MAAVKQKASLHAQTHVVINIHTTFNNTIVTIADSKGHVLTQSSGGRVGYKNAKKSTQHAAMLAVKDCLDRALVKNPIKSVSIVSTGLGPGREPVIRTVMGYDVEILGFQDATGVAHNGTRGKGERRG